MTPAAGLERLVRAAAHRPRRVLAVVALLCAGATALALGLQPSAATSTLAGRSSDTYQATERYRERFGDHAIVVLVRGPLQQLVLTENLGRLLALEGCLSGNRPEGVGRRRAASAGRAPSSRARSRSRSSTARARSSTPPSARSRTSSSAQLDAKGARGRAGGRGGAPARAPPGQAAGASRSGVARAAEQLVYAQFVRDLLALNLKYGLDVDETPRLDDPDFVATLVFDPKRGATTPKARFAYLFPSSESAAIQVRLKPGLSDAQRERATALVRAAVRMPDFRLRNAEGYTVTGVPVLAEDLSEALAGLGRAAAAGGARRDGGRAGARLPAAAAARAAGGRARRGRADVRADGAGRRAADDGVDRGAAGAARARRRLRDPVPGADRGPADRRAAPRARRAWRCRRSRRRRSRRPPASSCCCSRRCRWCAGSACCSCSASGSRSRSR